MEGPVVSGSPEYSAVEDRILAIMENADHEDVCGRYFFMRSTADDKKEETIKILNLFIEMSEPGPLQENLRLAFSNDTSNMDAASIEGMRNVFDTFVEREQKVALAYAQYKKCFPMQIWNCCKKLCFVSMAIDSAKYNQIRDLLLIHSHVEKCHAEREGISFIIEKRRKGVGTSTLAYVTKSRKEREALSNDTHGTARQENLQEFGAFVQQLLPFLYAQVESPCARSKLPMKLCTPAICCLLGISRNFLYLRKTASDKNAATDDEFTCLIDSTGMRMRQHRQNSLRISRPTIQSLPNYNCGCDIPCFNGADSWALVIEYEEFSQLSRELHPRHKENFFLINRMYDPYFNKTLSICNKALSALYNVSESLIADVRRTIDSMCQDAFTFDRQMLKDGARLYRYHRNHPINRCDDSVREKIEHHLDIVLRANPAGSDGGSVCRVYSPEINTHEKLRETLKEVLAANEEVEVELSASTIQRMVNSYLNQRNLKAISFTQSDHNACPLCKSLQYSILQFTKEARLIQRDIDSLKKSEQDLDLTDNEREERLDELEHALATKRYQEDECLRELQRHTGRDMRIRQIVKTLCDHFREKENEFRSRKASSKEFFKGWGWRSYLDRASITHQDDMTKVDIPHFIVTASVDITRWHYDVNAHVNAVTNDAVVFSHEQGMGAKNAALIVEEVLLEHLLRCNGESIKIIVSDNASVGKNWVTTIALPQYLVDQGLAEIVVIAFLENKPWKMARRYGVRSVPDTEPKTDSSEC